MNEIKIFENEQFGEVRVLEKDGEPWFVGKDVAEILGYSETNAMTKRLDQQDFISDKLAGMNMKSTLINESGLYDAIFGSKLPEARAFKRWVTSEVLPAIRKTGTYNLPKSELDLFELSLNAIKENREQINAVNNDLQEFKRDMPILGIEESRITGAVRKKGTDCLGGKDTAAYKNKSLRGKIYSDIYSQLKREFGVGSYKAIKRNQSEKAISIIKEYEMPFVLSEQVKELNSQIMMGR